ncbi:MAG: tail fiber domain-containing protein [Akkermansiaceae bacterium]|nr:tail fiber domain-containing protein [Akkermansiaceae bacterium]
MKKIAILFTTLCLLQSVHAQTITSAVPGYISYQGRALDTTGAVIGLAAPVNRTVTFRVWDHPSNVLLANLLYSEQQTVTISGGEFSVLIGQGVATTGTTFGYSESTKGVPTVKIGDLAVFGGSTRYLGVTIDDGTVAVDNEITPRQQIVSSAYAFRAKYAEQLGSNGGAALTALDSGNVGIGNTAPPSLFTVSGANTSTTTSTPQLLVTADDITERLRIGVDSTGNGTGFIQAYKESTGAQNLLLNPSGGNVGIGTASPAVALSVTGAITATGAITGGSVSTAGTITATGAITGGSFVTSGNIGIGTKLTIGSLGGDASTLSPSFITNAGAVGTSAGSELILGNFGFNANSNSSLAISALRTAAGTNWFDTALILGMNVDVTKRAGGAFISIHGNGNVGIGTTTPGVPLNFANTLGEKIALWGQGAGGYGFGIQGGLLQIHTADSTSDVAFGYGSSAAMTETMRIKGNGNVGIGNTSPLGKFTVNSGNPAFTIGTGDPATGAWIRNDGSNTVYSTNVGDMYFGFSGSAKSLHFMGGGTTDGMVILSSGIVQIGSASTLGKLNVGTKLASYDRYGVLYTDGASGNNNYETNVPLSIWADGYVAASIFHVNSDIRIKNILHATDSAKDLQTLMAMQVTDYQFKDTVTNGNRPQKKLIAQQVEEFYPEAVNTTKGVVPDILKKATVKDGWIELATDLKVGERVRLILPSGESIEEVLEVRGDAFRTSLKSAEEKTFVYGREVPDFRSVDYDAIAMLNVSATQELVRKVKSVQDENAALRRELAAKDASVEARLIALEQRLTKGSAPETVSIKTANAAN